MSLFFKHFLHNGPFSGVIDTFQRDVYSVRVYFAVITKCECFCREIATLLVAQITHLKFQ